mmetsp:Transcript_18492/g.50503  ORF Transcript_18492/g.50503 Transcript_18492/m.50503 type:complete len:283 (+) Transcript_18492:175-1023(+)
MALLDNNTTTATATATKEEEEEDGDLAAAETHSPPNNISHPEKDAFVVKDGDDMLANATANLEEEPSNESIVNEHKNNNNNNNSYTMAEALFPGATDAAAAAAGAASADAASNGQPIDLNPHIDTQQSYAKNQAAGTPLSNLFIGDSTLGCKSDADEQLILHISFREFVKIKSIQFVAFNNGVDPELNPSKVHLFVNRENLGFEDAEDVDPQQTLHLTAEDLKQGSAPIKLKYVLYQRVSSLTLFIEDNQGAEITALGALKLYGHTVVGTNMGDFKKQPGQE